MAIVIRTEKGSPLSYAELDGNFIDLDTRLNQLEEAEVVSVNGQSGAVVLTTTNIPQGDNLYYTAERFDTSFATKRTDNLIEGTNNLYFTTARARSSLVAGTGIGYNPTTGTISLNTTTTNVSEGTNLYFTNARVDSRIATTTADTLFDINYGTSPTTGDVLTWNTISNKWEPAQPPGATGGEANTGSNIGAGQGLFATKVGIDLRFYSLSGSEGIEIAAPVNNVVIISLGDTLTTSRIQTLSNANIELFPDGSGIVVANALAVSNLTSTRIPFASTNGLLLDDADLTFNGTTVRVPQVNATVSTGTAPFIVTSTTRVANLNVANAGYADTADSATSATTASTVTTAAQPNITSLGTLTDLTVDNININASTISSINVDGNINVTPNGNGRTVISNVVVSSTVANALLFTDANSVVANNANLIFDGSNLNVNLNTNFIQSITTTNLISPNISTLSNANINISPNGTGRVGIGTSTPSSLLDVNGTVTTKDLIGNGNVVLGESSASNITLTGRFATTLLPSTTNAYDLGSSSNRFRGLFVAGNIDTTNRIISTLSTGTAPFTVTSTTRVANLNVANAGFADNAGTVTTAAQPNITSVGTLTSLGVNGTITGTRLISNIATGTAPLTVTSTTQVANLNVATAGTAGTVTTAAQPNITSVGTLTSLTIAAGNATVAPVTLTSGTLTTSPAAGRLEYNGTALYFTPDTSTGRTITFSPALVRLNGNRTKATNNTTLEAIFDTASDSINLKANTLYYFRGYYNLSTSASGTAGGIQLGFAFSNAQQDIAYVAKSFTVGSSTTQTTIFNTVATAVTVTATSTSAVNYIIEVEGWFKSNAATGGTFIPQFTQSVVGSSVAPSANAGTWLSLQPMGGVSDTIISGTWA